MTTTTTTMKRRRKKKRKTGRRSSRSESCAQVATVAMHATGLLPSSAEPMGRSMTETGPRRKTTRSCSAQAVAALSVIRENLGYRTSPILLLDSLSPIRPCQHPARIKTLATEAAFGQTCGGKGSWRWYSCYSLPLRSPCQRGERKGSDAFSGQRASMCHPKAALRSLCMAQDQTLGHQTEEYCEA